MRRIVVLLAVVALVAGTVCAGELAGVKLPDQITVDGATLHLNGMGVRKKLWIKVYVGALYLEHTSHSPDEILAAKEYKRIEMHFLTNKATKKKMDKAWWEGFEKNSPDKVDALRGQIEQLVGFFGDMKKGDVIAFTITPEGETKVELNGQVKGTIAGQDFAEALVKLWLGPHPPSEDLKEGMLGL
jgi:hypothetical protein